MHLVRTIVFCGLVFCAAASPINQPPPPQGNTCSCLLGQLLLKLTDLVKNQKSPCFSPLVGAAVENLKKDGILTTVAPPKIPEPIVTAIPSSSFELAAGPVTGDEVTATTTVETATPASPTTGGDESENSATTTKATPTLTFSGTKSTDLASGLSSELEESETTTKSPSSTPSTVPTVSAPLEETETTPTTLIEEPTTTQSAPILLREADPDQSQGIGSDYLRRGGKTTTLEPIPTASPHNPHEDAQGKCPCPNLDHKLLYVPLLRFEGKPDKKSFQFYIDCLFGDKQ